MNLWQIVFVWIDAVRFTLRSRASADITGRSGGETISS